MGRTRTAAAELAAMNGDGPGPDSAEAVVSPSNKCRGNGNSHLSVPLQSG